MKLSALRAVKSFSITVKGTDEKINFKAHPLTPADVAALDADSKKLPERMAVKITEWDITNEEGATLSITAENMREIPYSVLLAFQDALLKEAYPTDPKDK